MKLPDDPKARAETVVNYMRRYDQLAVEYNIQIEEVGPGFAKVSMTVTEKMLNAVRLCHGGAIFSLADFAFAAASNSHGQVSVALSATISYPAPARKGDRLTAVAREIARTRRTGLYQVEVTRQDGTLVAYFTGNVFVRDDSLEEWLNKSADK